MSRNSTHIGNRGSDTQNELKVLHANDKIINKTFMMEVLIWISFLLPSDHHDKIPNLNDFYRCCYSRNLNMK